MTELQNTSTDSLSKRERRLLKQQRRRERKERQAQMEVDILERATDVINLALNQQLQEMGNTRQVRQPAQQIQYVTHSRQMDPAKSQGRYAGVGSQSGCQACKRRLFDPF